MKFYFIIFILFLTGLTGNRLHAKRYVKIATIGGVPPANAKIEEPQELTEYVIRYWKGELNKVLSQKPDLIVLPEACDRPRGLSTEEQFEYYRVRKNQVKDFFSSVAKENSCYIVFGSKWETENGNFLNSSFVINRNGELLGRYDKNFPTIGEIESNVIPGKDVPVFQFDFARIACAICFDLNFDELRREYVKAQPEIILFSSMYHGGLVQNYWAYSCESFFVGSMGFTNIPSEIRNPLGEVIASSTNYYNYVVADVNLDTKLVHLGYNREKLRALKDKYGDEVTIYDPGHVGAVLVTSEHDNISVAQMLNEFKIDPMSRYFERSREYREKKIR